MALLDDNSTGIVTVVGNELLVDAKDIDAAALRLGAPAGQGTMAKISMDVQDDPGSRSGRKEMVCITGAQSRGKGGEFSVSLLKPGGQSVDADMVKVIEANHEDGISFKLPISAPNLQGAGGGNQFFSLDAVSGRRLLFNPQADKAWPLGVIVVYDVTGGQLKAIGKIRVEPL
jgi:hypothetical protein